jgi:hypothetical protein
MFGKRKLQKRLDALEAAVGDLETALALLAPFGPEMDADHAGALGALDAKKRAKASRLFSEGLDSILGYTAEGGSDDGE